MSRLILNIFKYEVI